MSSQDRITETQITMAVKMKVIFPGTGRMRDQAMINSSMKTSIRIEIIMTCNNTTESLMKHSLTTTKTKGKEHPIYKWRNTTELKYTWRYSKI